MIWSKSKPFYETVHLIQAVPYTSKFIAYKMSIYSISVVGRNFDNIFYELNWKAKGMSQCDLFYRGQNQNKPDIYLTQFCV